MIGFKEWTSGRDAAIRLGISVYELHKLAMAGEIRTLIVPGKPVKFNLEDIRQLLKAEPSHPAM